MRDFRGSLSKKIVSPDLLTLQPLLTSLRRSSVPVSVPGRVRAVAGNFDAEILLHAPTRLDEEDLGLPAQTGTVSAVEAGQETTLNRDAISVRAQQPSSLTVRRDGHAEAVGR